MASPQGKHERRLDGWNLVVGIFIAIGTAMLVYIALVPSLSRTPPGPYRYFVSVPGLNCSDNHAKWITAPNSQVKCLTDRMILSTATTHAIAQEFFYGNQHLPTNNQIVVDINSITQGSCAGVITRNSDSRKGGYAFAICSDGSWAIDIYNNLDIPSTLAKGLINSSSAYSMVATTQGVILKLNINDTPIAEVADGTFTNTDSICLFVSPDTNTATLPLSMMSASFSNFGFQEIASS
jgi:hypothetical protein